MVKAKRVLFFNISLMALLIAFALILPGSFTAMMEKPDLYRHAKFIHILSVTLFFGNTVIGTIWEMRSLLSGKPEIIRYTYQTVVWLDAVFAAPLILIAVVSGIMLGTILGGIWTMGWLSVSFLLFMLCGVLWLVADIPTQYRVNRLFESVEPGSESVPPRLARLLWRRMGINFVGAALLLVVFFLMVHKPDLPKIIHAGQHRRSLSAIDPQ